MAKKDEQEPLKFTAEQLREIDKGVESLKSGKRWTSEEAHENARRRTREWIQATKKDLSA